MTHLKQDVELSFKLLEFSLRMVCYAELEKIDAQEFGQDLQINLPEENVSYSNGAFTSSEEIIKASQMAVGAAFGATAICLDCFLENSSSTDQNLVALNSLISAVRNAFSHGVAAPYWHVKQHNLKILDLAFLKGPKVDLKNLNGLAFEYSHIGGLAVWHRIKDHVISST